MKVISAPSAESWCWRFRCKSCGTKAEAGAADLEHDRFKTSGNFFDGSAVVETRYYVNCPGCQALVFVPEGKLTWAAKQAARSFAEVLAERKAQAAAERDPGSRGGE